jgi:hypothetical protein
VGQIHRGFFAIGEAGESSRLTEVEPMPESTGRLSSYETTGDRKSSAAQLLVRLFLPAFWQAEASMASGVPLALA